MALSPRPLCTLLQTAAFMAIWWLADQAVSRLHLPAPAGVVGLLALTVLFMTGLIAPTWLEAGAAWLLGEMLLFFVPPMMALINHADLLSPTGLKLGLVVVAGTLMVLSAVGLTVQHVIRLEDRLHGRHADGTSA